MHMYSTDICIAGAGIIGLSLALELNARGLRVAVVEAGSPLREASSAAAGMLAADDPDNPVELHLLAQLSISLYPEFLDRLRVLGGIGVPFQTRRTLQKTRFGGESRESALATEVETRLRGESWQGGSFTELQEHSLDPRQLAQALLAAVATTSIRIIAETRLVSTKSLSGTVALDTTRESIEAAHFVDCTGAWANDPAYAVVPIKGQMLAVATPVGWPLDAVVRTGEFYVVPRTLGPNAGRTVIGATVEDVGFDKHVDASAIEALHRRAAALLPRLMGTTVLESWCGLRPATTDRLPLIGPHPAKERHWVATGHFRNGILLAPATARVMVQSILREAHSVSLARFDPSRELVHKHP